MSEVEPRLPSPEAEPLLEAHASQEKASNKAETAAENRPEAQLDPIEKIRQSIEQAAAPTAEVTPAATAAAEPKQQYGIGRERKKQAFKEELRAVEKQLSTPERALSKVVNNRAVSAASAAGEKTIARPTALVWGGLFALLASLTLYLLAKYIGFRYNYTIGLLAFVGGYVLGLLVELIVRAFHRSPNA